jgi:polar amino acid transport system substrate-binding protein
MIKTKKWNLFLLITVFCLINRTGYASIGKIAIKVSINDADWPPFNLRGDGLDQPGIMKEIGNICFKSMGVEVEYRALPIERMQTEIQQGTLDINFFSYKKEREAFVDFSSEPAFRSGYRPIALRGSGITIKRLSDFDPHRLGHTIGFRYSNEFLEYILHRKKKRNLDEATTVESNLKKLLAKRIDIFVAEYNSLLYLAEMMKVRDKIEVLDYQVQEADYFLALSKKSPRVIDREAFTKSFDRCLKDLKASGRYCETLERYGLPCTAHKK